MPPTMLLSLANKVSKSFPQSTFHTVTVGDNVIQEAAQTAWHTTEFFCVVCCMAKQDTAGNQENQGLHFRVVFFSYSFSYTSFSLEAQRHVSFLVIIQKSNLLLKNLFRTHKSN